MKKFTFNDGILSHEPNKEAITDIENILGHEVTGHTILIYESSRLGCDEEECSVKPVNEGDKGHWTCVLGNCIFVPAP